MRLGFRVPGCGEIGRVWFAREMRDERVVERSGHGEGAYGFIILITFTYHPTLS